MDAPRDCHTKWSKSEEKRQIQYSIICLWNLTCDTKKLIDKTETDSQDTDNEPTVIKGKKALGGIN